MVKMNPEDPATPCGLVAKSYFNDTFLIGGQTIDSKGIAWASDVAYKYFNANKTKDGTSVNWKQKQWIDMTDGKSNFNSHSFRTFHCLDENRWTLNL